jgi:hypothetical protein
MMETDMLPQFARASLVLSVCGLLGVLPACGLFSGGSETVDASEEEQSLDRFSDVFGTVTVDFFFDDSPDCEVVYDVVALPSTNADACVLCEVGARIDLVVEGNSCGDRVGSTDIIDVGLGLDVDAPGVWSGADGWQLLTEGDLDGSSFRGTSPVLEDADGFGSRSSVDLSW